MSQAPHPLERFFLESRLARIDSVLESRTGHITVVLDEVQNPHNISAVLRSADAFGIQNIILVGESFTYSRGISLGTERWLTLKQFAKPAEALELLRKEEFTPVILQAEELSKSQGKSSFAVQSLPFEKKLALIFGNEHRGVSSEFTSAEPLIHAHIPMVGFVESLNISVAAAITFFSAYLGGRPQMDATAREELRGQWLVKDLRGGEEILKALSQSEE